ncbi:MAG: TraR/DksA family transcriptional regulator [Acidimicrobiia bacterium]|nr:TraR/DksA family transcriptional regulator [Acidimicrobiia bacterium]
MDPSRAERDVKKGLQDRLIELGRELDRVTAPPVEGSTVGFGKRVGEGTTEAVERISSTATARSLARSIAEIEVALERLSLGLYGICSACGDDIPEARLEARPATALCVGCAAAG